jgi:hypothetical protein
MNLEPQVLIIGGGVTGTGIARDLALRGIPSLLVEKRDINAGASGSNHGLLHSGARYVASDREAAMECHEEGEILRKIAPQCIEDTGGFFVGVEGDDENYIASMKDVPVNEVIENFGDDPNKYIKKPYSDTPTINQETGPANPVSQPQYIVIKIQNRDVVENVFPEPGCYLVKDVIPAT